MKSAFITIFSLLVVSYTVLGQMPNVPTLKIDVPQIVAEVNGDKISRSSLAAECLQLYGENELQELINKTLIRLECERQKITITAEEINAEVLRMAQTFKLTSEQWLQILEQERNISPEQYQQDTVWKILALGKLAGQRLTINETELKKAYDAEFGPAVQVRQIILPSKNEAEIVFAELKEHPDPETFASVAKNRSIDPASQPYGGMLHPIRRGVINNPNIEKVLFAMKPGEMSPIFEFSGYFAIYRCEAHLPPHEVDFNAVEEQLRMKIRDTKLRQVADEVFLELQNQTKIQIVFGNPTLYNQYPGVAAMINEHIISQQELAEICIQKHGKEVLSDIMSRLLVEQACRREKIVIAEQDIDNEIREMASKHLSLKPDGSANVELWLKQATEDSGLSIPMYRKNIILPILSLKRLTLNQIVVTEEDKQRAFEANFGRKVRCLAIFFNAQNQRRAQEVWQMANRNKTEENFGDLAEKYSFDPDSQLGRGVIPPIARYCGQPELEKAAFSLKPNELSEIIQADDCFVILYCLGYVEPLPVNFKDVEDELVKDIYEKKQQIIIDRYFGKLYKQATLDNYLTDESQNPALERAIREEPSLRQ